MLFIFFIIFIFQLEQKGKLQRHIAKDVSMWNVICPVPS